MYLVDSDRDTSSKEEEAGYFDVTTFDLLSYTFVEHRFNTKGEHSCLSGTTSEFTSSFVVTVDSSFSSFADLTISSIATLHTLFFSRKFSFFNVYEIYGAVVWFVRFDS